MLGQTSPLQATDRSADGLCARTRTNGIAVRRRVLPAAALACLLVGIGLSSLLSADRSAPLPSVRSASLAGTGSASLSAAARGSLSAALGAANPVYHLAAVGGTFVANNPSQHMSARFSASGVQLGSRALKLDLSLRSIGRGSSLRSLGAVAPSVNANRASYARAGLTEWFVNGPLGLEQGYKLLRAPHSTSAGGPLVLSMAVAGNARATLARDAQSVMFQHGASTLRYGGLSATDASGRALHGWLALRGGRLSLLVDVAHARFPLTIDPLIQQGGKLTGGGEQESGLFGSSTALSADGSTALIGGPGDNDRRGAVWAFTRSGSGWTQQGEKLTSGEEIGAGGQEQCEEEAAEEPEAPGECSFGQSVALSADGNTAVVGDPSHTSAPGAAWIFTRSNGAWTRLGAPLLGPKETGEGRFGKSVALSADGTIAVVGNPGAADTRGRAWVFTRSGETWSRQAELVGAEGSRFARFGRSVALSANANTVLVGGPADSGTAGAAWVFTRSGSNWNQLGGKLTGGEEAEGHFGRSVALSADGSTALIGGQSDDAGRGAVWAFARSGGSFAQQGAKIVSKKLGGEAHFGASVSLSGEGNSALVGAPRAESIGSRPEAGVGAVTVLTRSGAVWAELEAENEKVSQLAGTGASGKGWAGASVALSSDGLVALSGAPSDGGRVGAAWIFAESPPGAVPPPTVTSVFPGHGPTSGETSVVVTGTNFNAEEGVKFGGTPATTVEVLSAVQLRATSPPEPEGTVDVTVTTKTGTSAISSNDTFTYESTGTKGLKGKGTGAGGGSSTTGTVPADPAGGVLGSTGTANAACQVSLHSKHIAVTLRRTAAIRLMRTGAGQCVGTVTLKYKKKTKGRHYKLTTIGTARFSIAPGRSQVIKITLNKTGRKVFRASHGKLNASAAVVRAVPAPTQARTASVRLSVKKKPKAKTGGK